MDSRLLLLLLEGISICSLRKVKYIFIYLKEPEAKWIQSTETEKRQHFLLLSQPQQHQQYFSSDGSNIQQLSAQQQQQQYIHHNTENGLSHSSADFGRIRCF
jgi:hypothetical protein